MNEIVLHNSDLVPSPAAVVLASSPPAQPSVLSPQSCADRTDELILQMWLAGLSINTQRNYLAHARRMMQFVGKPLAAVNLEDLQRFAADLDAQGLAAASRKTTLAAVKSLFSFASADGIRHTQYNVAAAIRLPRGKETLNERILTEAQVHALIDAAGVGTFAVRNRMIAELLYLVGLRAEELTDLRWKDAQPDGSGGVLTIYGKGDKTRHVRLEAQGWTLLMSWRKDAADEQPMFVSRQGGQGGALSTVQVWRIISGAARRAGLKASTHWLRHSHATHAIDHGCDLWVLQKSLGHASIDTTQQYVHSRPKQSSSAFVKRGSDGK